MSWRTFIYMYQQCYVSLNSPLVFLLTIQRHFLHCNFFVYASVVSYMVFVLVFTTDRSKAVVLLLFSFQVAWPCGYSLRGFRHPHPPPPPPSLFFIISVLCLIVVFSGFYLALWSPYITKTCLYNFDKPHFFIVKLWFTGVYIIFVISAQKHRLWYSLVHTTYVFKQKCEKCQSFYLKNFSFWW